MICYFFSRIRPRIAAKGEEYHYMLEQLLSELRQLGSSAEQLIEQATIFTRLALLLVPVGLIGIWRWGVWLLRKLIGLRYVSTPLANSSLTLSIVTPVYNEDPFLFKTALDSWMINAPNQLIAVIDHSDSACIAVFNEFVSAQHKNTLCYELIVTQKPGKRAALADGILAATCDIVALVDSDTIWSEDIRELILPPFADPDVGGVGTRQNVLAPNSMPQRLFDVYLDLRYLDEIRFLSAAGDALTCLSGRTAVYRHSAIFPLVDELVNETFLGKPVISGDDKCLTHLVQRDGWKVRYQDAARVYTPGADRMKIFLRQRLRWSRNSWRADLRALSSKWLWKRRALAFQLVDRLVQPVTTLIAPTYFILSLVYQQWLTTIVLLGWWFVSRAIKIWPHLKRRRSNLMILPAYIVISYWFAVMRIYAFFTMNEQGWITRWDKSRFNKNTFFEMVPGYIGTGLIILLVSSFINLIYSRQLLLASMLHPDVYATEAELPFYENIKSDRSLVTLLANTPPPNLREVGVRSLSSTNQTASIAGNTSRTNIGRANIGRTSSSKTNTNSQGIDSQSIDSQSIDSQSTDEQNTVNSSNIVASYRVGQGDTEVRLARKYGIERSGISAQRQEQRALGGNYDQWTEGDKVSLQLPFKSAEAYRQFLNRALPIREANEAQNHSIEYQPESNTIVVKGRLYTVTLHDIYLALSNNDLLENEGDGIYLLKANLTLSPHTMLLLEHTDMTWLKLKSDLQESVRIFGNSGNVFIDGIAISSWDPINNDYDRESADGRSYIRVDNGRMDIINSTISYLGQPHTRSSGGGVYGLSWRIDNNSMVGEQLVTGMIEHNHIHNNYIGLYIFGATGMQIRHNDINNNMRNGIDIAQSSNHFVVEDNAISNNGNYGLIFSRSCYANIIRKNQITKNAHYGIVLDRESVFNTIVDNTISQNQDAIGIWRSNRNLLANNKISNNETGILLNKKSAYNTLIDNHLWANRENGIYLNDGAYHNQVWQNDIEQHAKGIYLRAPENFVRQNRIQENDHGIFIDEEASNNLITENTLSKNRIGLYLKTKPDDYILGNIFDENNDNQANMRITDLWSTNTEVSANKQ